MTDSIAEEKNDSIEVEIVYALCKRQVLLTLQVPVGTNVEQAIYQSRIINQFPEIDLNINRLGIFSRFVERKTILRPRDRIEIYRPLQIDPKEARRLRIKQKSVKQHS